MDVVRILLVDDFALFRDGLRAVIERQPDMMVIDEACDGETAVCSAREKLPDVILMDLHFPQDGGIDALLQILTDNPDAKVIALLGSSDRETVSRIVQAGARGYLMKDTRAAELVQAVRLVANGGAVIDPGIAAQLLTDYRRLMKHEHAKSGVSFSGRDLEMLRCLAAGASNREIAQKMFLSEQTVKNLLSDIYRKLGAENRTEAVALALRDGLIRHEPQH